MGSILRDITERKRAEEEIKHTQAFLDSIVENIPSMIFVKEADGLAFVRWNRAAEKLTGFPKPDMLGKNDYDIVPKEEAEFFTGKDRQVLASVQLVDIPEEPIHTLYRGVRILHTKKIPLLDVTGQSRYLSGCMKPSGNNTSACNDPRLN